MFREKFRYYKRKVPPPDLSNVLDFSGNFKLFTKMNYCLIIMRFISCMIVNEFYFIYYTHIYLYMVIILLQVKGYNVDNIDCEELGIIDPVQWKIYESDLYKGGYCYLYFLIFVYLSPIYKYDIYRSNLMAINEFNIYVDIF